MIEPFWISVVALSAAATVYAVFCSRSAERRARKADRRAGRAERRADKAERMVRAHAKAVSLVANADLAAEADVDVPGQRKDQRRFSVVRNTTAALLGATGISALLGFIRRNPAYAALGGPPILAGAGVGVFILLLPPGDGPNVTASPPSVERSPGQLIPPTARPESGIPPQQDSEPAAFETPVRVEPTSTSQPAPSTPATSTTVPRTEEDSTVSPDQPTSEPPASEPAAPEPTAPDPDNEPEGRTGGEGDDQLGNNEDADDGLCLNNPVAPICVIIDLSLIDGEHR